MIKYLVALTESGGLADAERRGWSRLARSRFATPENDDVRLVWRFLDMVPDRSGVTRFVRSADFPGDPMERTDDGNLKYPEAARFAEFVEIGWAEWEA